MAARKKKEAFVDSSFVSAKEEKLGAGAGFEPAAFRL